MVAITIQAFALAGFAFTSTFAATCYNGKPGHETPSDHDHFNCEQAAAQFIADLTADPNRGGKVAVPHQAAHGNYNFDVAVGGCHVQLHPYNYNEAAGETQIPFEHLTDAISKLYHCTSGNVGIQDTQNWGLFVQPGYTTNSADVVGEDATTNSTTAELSPETTRSHVQRSRIEKRFRTPSDRRGGFARISGFLFYHTSIIFQQRSSSNPSSDRVRQLSDSLWTRIANLRDQGSSATDVDDNV